MTQTALVSKLRPLEILLVDDDEGAIVLVERALASEECVPRIHVVKDGVEAMWFLRRTGEFADAPRPHLVLLDLNMPRKNGREVLVEIKQDADLRSIPVVVLTTSSSEEDIRSTYCQYANCFVTKPLVFKDFIEKIQEITRFWTTVAELPSR